MVRKRKKHSDEFKARIALEAVKGIKTLSEISSENSLHPNAISKWKRQLIAGAPAPFSPKGAGKKIAEYHSIGKRNEAKKQ